MNEADCRGVCYRMAREKAVELGLAYAAEVTKAVSVLNACKREET